MFYSFLSYVPPFRCLIFWCSFLVYYLIFLYLYNLKLLGSVCLINFCHTTQHLGFEVFGGVFLCFLVLFYFLPTHLAVAWVNIWTFSSPPSSPPPPYSPPSSHHQIFFLIGTENTVGGVGLWLCMPSCLNF